jgi:hypothetical protein
MLRGFYNECGCGRSLEAPFEGAAGWRDAAARERLVGRSLPSDDV